MPIFLMHSLLPLTTPPIIFCYVLRAPDETPFLDLNPIDLSLLPPSFVAPAPHLRRRLQVRTTKLRHLLMTIPSTKKKKHKYTISLCPIIMIHPNKVKIKINMFYLNQLLLLILPILVDLELVLSHELFLSTSTAQVDRAQEINIIHPIVSVLFLLITPLPIKKERTLSKIQPLRTLPHP